MQVIRNEDVYGEELPGNAKLLDKSGNKQESDVHWRSTNGTGNFNYRMIYALILPSKVPRFCLQVWDKNKIHSNASIADAVLHLGGIFKKAYRTKNVVSIPKQWLNMTHPMFKGIQMKVEIK
ncbi:MAG: hypothetical protein EZS28_028263 [Streblomastix strix]|uniref:Uncharacterized protein n=1 Tax=Streblomastix strix TaxID=222440 RepID=A0A5J4V1H2_9EUKA|nr:MAG: hypothetical protein EZS28_028263 [Streblomastix strix]